jgi:predicted phage terminase large subunit-like protein
LKPVSAESIDREIVRQGGLIEFVQLAWPQVDPAEFQPSWHIEEICHHLEAVTRGECFKLLINIPPGFSKSLIVSVLWPAWDWIRHASRKYICASYDASLALRDAKKMRDLVMSEWFQDRWGSIVGIPHEATKKTGEFQNDRGGFRISVGIGGGVLGKHGNVHICDDPHNIKDLQGSLDSVKKNIDKVQRFWRETMPSRAVDKKTLARVIVMQRLHEHDLSGTVLEEGGYTHLCLPLHYATSSPHRRIILPCKTPLGGDHRTKEGELLCESRMNEETAAATKVEMGSAAWDGQYEQRPPNAQGNIIKRAWMTKFWKELPRGGFLIQSWDAAFKDTKECSHVCGQVWLDAGGVFYLVDQFYDQVDFVGTCTAVATMTGKHPRARGKLVEGKANGPAVISVMKGKIPGLIEVEPEGGKEARLFAVSPLFESGSVVLPDPEVNPWVHDYIEELATMPGSPKNDRTDATSQALLYLTTKKSLLVEAMRNAGEFCAILGL